MATAGIIAEERLVSTAQAGMTLGVGATYMAALKRAAGVRGHKVLVSGLRRYLRRNPEFTVRAAPPAQRMPRKRWRAQRSQKTKPATV